MAPEVGKEDTSLPTFHKQLSDFSHIEIYVYKIRNDATQVLQN